jgi:hypothetical protein
MLLLRTKNSRGANAPHLLPFVVGFIIKKTQTHTNNKNNNQKKNEKEAYLSQQKVLQSP